MSSSDAALLQEIQRLSGAIDRHKSYGSTPPPNASSHNLNHNVNPATANWKYVNPAMANKKYVNPGLVNKSKPNVKPSDATRELVINGVIFQSSRRKLTRKDAIGSKVAVSQTVSAGTSRPGDAYGGKGDNPPSTKRIYKSRLSKRKAGRNNMVLDNVKGTRTGRAPKRRKIDKQCRFFTKTGVCQRGLTCPYQHDPEKIAICALFLTQSCPNSAETCHLSHDPTPARVPLCHHFENYGRCGRQSCPYPHVRVGQRHGVCRDFAVVGYCEKGIDCDQQHVRECPDFAEKGVCPYQACKLPHVIRANRRRQTGQAPEQQNSVTPAVSHINQTSTLVEEENASASQGTFNSGGTVPEAAEEYIPLTFEESDDDEEEGVEEGDEVESSEEESDE